MFFDLKRSGVHNIGIVSDASHQRALSRLLGEDDAAGKFAAMLICEPSERDSPGKVRVEILGYTVGALDPRNAAHYREILAKSGRKDQTATCGAEIVGVTEIGKGPLGVRLDLPGVTPAPDAVRSPILVATPVVQPIKKRKIRAGWIIALSAAGIAIVIAVGYGTIAAVRASHRTPSIEPESSNRESERTMPPEPAAPKPAPKRVTVIAGKVDAPLAMVRATYVSGPADLDAYYAAVGKKDAVAAKKVATSGDLVIVAESLPVAVESRSRGYAYFRPTEGEYEGKLFIARDGDITEEKR